MKCGAHGCLFVVVAVLISITGCTAGKQYEQNGGMVNQTAVDLRRDEAEFVKDKIRSAAPDLELVDGGSLGPFPCSEDRPDEFYYTQAWVIEPAKADITLILEQFEDLMTRSGYKIDSSRVDSPRPTIVFFDGEREVEVSEFSDLGTLRFNLITSCGR